MYSNFDLRLNGKARKMWDLVCLGGGGGAAAGSIVGAGVTAIGAHKQRQLQKQAHKLQEQQRQEAMKHVSMGNIREIGNQLFPGLMGLGSRSNVSPEIMDVVRGGGAGTSSRITMTEDLKAPIEGRALGGPVQENQPVMVGEQGPEVIVPGRDGQVIPNPTTAPPRGNVGTPGNIGGAPGPGVDTPGNIGIPGNLGGEPISAPGGPGIGAPQEVGSVEDDQGVREGFVGEAMDPTTAGGSLGDLSMGHAINFLADPGQIGTEQYERAQEQANIGLQTNIQGMMGGLTGMGIDPRSPMAQIMMQGAVNQSNKLRNEAARDLSLQQEELRREDIETGMTAYQNFLTQVFNLIGMQADVIGGGDFQNIQNPINPYENIGSAIAQGGLLASQNPPASSSGPPSETGGGGETL